MALMPDIIGALIVRTTSDAQVTSLVGSGAGWLNSQSGNRVAQGINSDWKMPTHAIVIRLAGGPPGDQSVRKQFTRFDWNFYGSNIFECTRLWRATHPILCPGQESSSGTSFRAKNVVVYDIAQESGPLPDEEPNTRFPVLIVPYLVTWSEVPFS